MAQEDLLPMRKALLEWRAAHGVTQREAADALDVSRKTYVLFELCRWLPHPRARAHLARRLRAVAPAAADEFARLLAANGAEDVESPVEALVDPRDAKLVFDSALLALAERLDVSVKTLRPAVIELLHALSAGGVGMGQALAAARSSTLRID